MKSKKIDMMLQLYSEMLEQNVAGDAVFYNTLISGLTYNKLLKDAVKVSKDSFLRKINLNEKVLLNLLKNLVQIAEVQSDLDGTIESDILDLFEEIRFRKIFIENQLFNRVLRVGEGHQHKRSFKQPKCREESDNLGSPRNLSCLEYIY
jgi:hypothetical protein